MSQYFSYTFFTFLSIDLLAIAGDLPVTWTSPILPKLYSNNSDINPLPSPITSVEESWIGSLINIGAILGPLPFGLLSTKYGRKISLLCIAIPNLLSFLILSSIHNVYVYYFARLLAGISTGACYSLLPLYVTEIAQDSNRGMLSVSLSIFWTTGDLLPYILGPYMPVLWFNLILACIPGLFFISFLIIGPESPYYLVSKNQVDKAKTSLIKLMSNESNVEKEIIKIQTSLKQDHRGSYFEIFQTKTNLKVLGISLALIIFHQLSGINAVLFYTQFIMEASGTALSPEISSIIIGFVLFLSSLIIPFFVDSLGRRIFLIISALGMTLSLSTLGTYFYLKESFIVDISTIQWLPILSLVLFIIFYNVGYGPLPWTISAELFHVNVKQTGTSMVSFTGWLLSFLITKFFNDLNYVLGKAGTFWLFSICCLLAAIFAIRFVPETKGKSFEEIQQVLESKQF